MTGLRVRLGVGAGLIAALLVMVGVPTFAVDLSGTLAAQLSVNLEAPHAMDWQNRLDLRINEPLGPVDALATIQVQQAGPSADASFDLSEASLVWYGEKAKLQVGRTTLNWGTAMKLNPTNVVNPVDPMDPEMARKPVQLASVTYYPNYDWELTGVWILEFRPSVENLPGGPPIPIARPQGTLEESEAAVRAVYRGRGYDLSLIGFTGWDDSPSVTLTPQGPVAGFRRLSTVGAGYATSFAGAGLWAEGRYSRYADGDSALEAVVGGDYRTPQGIHLLAQVRWFHGGDDPTHLIMAAAEGPLASIHSWRVGILANPSAKSLTIQPEVGFSLADALALVVNASVTMGDAQASAPAIGVGVALRAHF